MANDLSNILPKILARGLLALREQAVMPRLVNADFATEAAQKGDTIDVPIPTVVKTIDVAPSNIPPVPADTTPEKVQIALDQWKQSTPFHLTDKQLVEVDRNEHFLPMQVSEAIRGLANEVNVSILREFFGVFGTAGTAGTTPFASDVKDATDSRKELNKQRAPRSNRRGVLDFDAEASALALKEFSDAEKIGSVDVKMEGEIGRKYGIDWVADDQVLTHTAGTQVGDATVTGAEAIGSTSIGITTDADDTVDLKKGDLIVFSGPDTQTYAVLADLTLGNNSTGNISISGPGKLGEANDGLAVALAGGETFAITASHVVNLVFHRDAFAYATRPLTAATMDLSLGSQILSMQDPQTGLVMRLEVSRQHKQVVWEFDMLWGARLVRPALAVRLLG